MHTACAFLNTEGGWVLFGVTPKSLKILGQEVTDNAQQEIAQALSGLEPAVDVKVKYIDVVDYSGHKVIVMHFDGWTFGERPYTYHGFPYYKVESTIKVMPRERYDEQLEVPYVALREALINALSHRRWEKYNLTISQAIYSQKELICKTSQ